ncbi:hypothetical protein L3V79_04750 [Thiotrichales bacterium 19S9-12]|nr:hypothetical protein [Thiotrichales bacterium 19S9-11]MCF6811666.1 hypothetical protein [Thiotrichales bacterium 19S9-12]
MKQRYIEIIDFLCSIGVLSNSDDYFENFEKLDGLKLKIEFINTPQDLKLYYDCFKGKYNIPIHNISSKGITFLLLDIESERYSFDGQVSGYIFCPFHNIKSISTIKNITMISQA